MASINIAKYTSTALKAMGSKHLDMDARLRLNHSNEDINKELTAQNYYIGADSWNEIIGSWEQRVKEADELHPPQRVKADRVTALMCEAKIPWEIVEQGREREFVEEYHKFLCDTFGKENVHGECLHVDETHLYIDKDGSEKMSMHHIHALVNPYAHWTDKKGNEHEGINAKNCLTRTFLKEMQREWDLTVKREFGINYMTYEPPQHKTVEELKRSEYQNVLINMKQKQEEIRKIENTLEWNKVRQQMAVDNIQELEAQKVQMEQQLDKVSLELEQGQNTLAEQQSIISEQTQKIDQQQTRLDRQAENISHNHEILDKQQTKFDGMAAKIEATDQYLTFETTLKDLLNMRPLPLNHERVTVSKERYEQIRYVLNAMLKQDKNTLHLIKNMPDELARKEKELQQMRSELDREKEKLEQERNNIRVTVEMEVKKYIDDHGLDNRIMRELSKQYPDFENKVAEIKEELKQEIHYHMSR